MDRLLDAWRADPRVDATVELCAMLIRAALKAGANKILPDDFVVGFANEARQKHPKNLDVAIAVADLYLATGLMAQATAVLDIGTALAPNDNRVKERLNKLGRRRRTQEFASRTPDPDTLDAPTTPLSDPPTEPAGRGPPPPLPGPRRQPTTIGLPAAPPPLPAPPVKVETKAVTPKPSPIRDDETTRTEAGLPPSLAQDMLAGMGSSKREGSSKPEAPSQPRRQQTALFGSIIAEAAPPFAPDRGAAPDSVGGDDGPPTRVNAEPPDEGPPTSVQAADDGPPTALTAAPKSDPFGAIPRINFGADDDEGPNTAMTRVGDRPIPSAARRPPPGEEDEPNTAMTRVGGEPASARRVAAPPMEQGKVELLRAATDRGPLPRTLHSAASPLANDDPPTQTSTNVSGLPAALAGMPPAAPSLTTPDAASKQPETPPAARVAARRAAVRRTGPGRDPRGLGAPLEGEELPTKVGAQPDPYLLEARTERGPAVAGPPAQPSLGASPAPERQSAALFRTEPSDSHTLDEDDGSVTGVQDLPPRALTPLPPPSDPETETKTAVRPLAMAANAKSVPRGKAPTEPIVRRSAPPIPIATIDDPRSAISQISQVATNQWRPPPPPPPLGAPPRPPTGRGPALPPPAPPSPAWANQAPVIEEPSGIESLDDDDDASAVTGLREIAPLAPSGSTYSGVPRAMRSTEPIKPNKPVVKGGTFAMSHSAAPPAFPAAAPGSIPPDDDDGGARTHVLSVREAAIAAQIDPRSPHGASSTPLPHSYAPTVGVLQRGNMFGAGAHPQSSPPRAQSAPPAQALYSAPPPQVPSFGAPPSQTFGPAAGQFLHQAAQDLSFGPPSYAPPNPVFGAPPVGSAPQIGPLDPDSYNPGAMATGTQVGFGQQPLPSRAPVASMGDPGMPSAAFPAPPTFDPRSSGDEQYGNTRFDGDPNNPAAMMQKPSEKSRPFKLYLALGVAVLAVASLVGYATYLLLSDRGSTEAQNSRLPDDIESALSRGTPGDLARADSELRKLEATPSLAVLLGRAKHRALVGLDVSGNAVGIDEAITAAKQGGASAADVAFAELASAVLNGDTAKSQAIIEENATLRDQSALFALFEGVLLERSGDPTAKARFSKAVELDARLLTARVRYARLLLLEGDLDGGAREALLLPDDHPTKPTLSALSWAARKISGKAEAPPKLTQTSADLPRCLHPVFTALAVLSAAPDVNRQKSPDVDPQLKQGIADADTPDLSLFFGELAFSRGDGATALAAAQRTLTLAPKLERGLELLGRIALSSGKLEQLETVLAPMPPETSRFLLAFVAYERSDLDKLSLLGKGLTEADDPHGIVRTRIAILRGAAPIAADVIEKLRGNDKIGGDLCAADAALDAGDLPRAKNVIDKWADGVLYPARALRKARLLRYEGKYADAEKLLELAPNLRATQVERILVEAESAQDRDHALSLVDDRLGEMGPFLEAYVLGRKGDQDKATRKLAALKTPGFDAPLSLRLVAALAFAELRDVERGETFVRVLHEKFAKNPDVQRAAKSFELDADRPAPKKPEKPAPKKRK